MPNEGRAFQELMKGLSLTPEEEKFLAASETAITAHINQSQIAVKIYSVKKLEQLVDRQILSNEALAASNAHYSKAMKWLTVTLIFVGFLQTMVYVGQLWISYRTMEETLKNAVRPFRFMDGNKFSTKISPQHFKWPHA